MSWFILSLLTLILWGLWGFLIKVASSFLTWKEYFVISGISTAAVVLAVYGWFRPTLSVQNIGTYYALLAGVVAVIPVIFFYLAVSLGKASIVVPLTALYPVVTILLSFLILGEKISAVQGLGILLALIAIALMSG